MCEGGPHLARELLAAGLLDEIFLTSRRCSRAASRVAGEALRILAGAEIDPPARLELLGTMSAGSYLFLRYAVAR